jgi:hypothetical protein
MKTPRLILIFIAGGLITYLTYRSKYQIDLFESLIWGFLILAGSGLLLWTVIKDIKNYKLARQFKSFLPTIIAVAFIAIILALEYKISIDRDKPSLIKVSYNGDINGTSIDFKNDGTYIFNNFSIGFSESQYGTYKISQDTITLDKSQLDNVIKTEYLVINEIEVKYDAGAKREKYLYQIAKGKVIENATEFRVIIDNRGQ